MGLFSKRRGVVGLDIGSSAVKACELRPAKGGAWEVINLGIEPLAPEAIVDGTILDAAVVIEAITKLFADNKIKTKDVATSVSGNAVIIKKISLPRMTPEELAESIRWEAEQYIPFDIEDVNIDYQILGEGAENMDVLLVAAKKDKINDYTSVISQAGLNPVIVDVDAFAMQGAYEANYEVPPGEVVALINIGASIMNINILRDGSSVFWRDISSGGNRFTEEIQKELHLSQEQADGLKRGQAVEGVPPQNAHPIIDHVTQDLATEVQKTFDFFVATAGAERIHRIVLAGGTARIPSIEQVLAERFGAQVEILNPFEQVQPTGKGVDDELASDAAGQMVIATGLALRQAIDGRINLIREKRVPGKAPVAAGAGVRPIHLAFIAILLAALAYVGLTYMNLKAEQTRLENKRAELEREKKRLEAIFKRKDELQKEKDLLERKIAIITELKNKQQGPVQLLDELSKNLPDYVWFQSVTEQSQSVLMDGFALNANKVADFIDNLQRSGHFTVVDGPHYNAQAGQVTFRVTTKFQVADATAAAAKAAGH